jgi:hypothetical protein
MKVAETDNNIAKLLSLRENCDLDSKKVDNFLKSASWMIPFDSLPNI